MIREFGDNVSRFCSSSLSKVLTCLKDSNDAEEKASNENVKKLISYLTTGKGSGEAYSRLAEFTDKFGNRVVGSDRLDAAIDHIVHELQQSGLKVQTEEFEIDGWRRGEEEAQLMEPFSKKLPVLGLGTSVPTPKSGIKAECITVLSFDELKQRKDEVKGKIVIFNQPWAHYGPSVQYRVNGASRASEYGAVAALIRSVTPYSIASPHTGSQTYDPKVEKIPAACITVEDAEMLHRMEQRGQKPVIQLRMTSSPCSNFRSRNIIADLEGSELPDEAVVICGHIDSWDVGQGAMDDGGGVFTAWQAVRAMQALNIRPRRTVRLVVFSGEEFGIYGGNDFYRRHKDDMGPKLSFMLESDGGTFTPNKIGFKGSDAAFKKIKELSSQLQPINKIEFIRGMGGPDITSWQQVGVPIGEIYTARTGQPAELYFNYHHTEGDMMTVQDPKEMDQCSAVFAVIAFVLADAAELLPR